MRDTAAHGSGEVDESEIWDERLGHNGVSHMPYYASRQCIQERVLSDEQCH